jgi:hypothetical protein
MLTVLIGCSFIFRRASHPALGREAGCEALFRIYLRIFESVNAFFENGSARIRDTLERIFRIATPFGYGFDEHRHPTTGHRHSRSEEKEPVR